MYQRSYFIAILFLLGFLTLSAQATTSFVGFEVSEGYNATANQTVDGRPSPGTEDVWDGPWNRASGNPSWAASSTGQAFAGSRSLRLQANMPSLTRPVEGGINGGNPHHRVTVYAYITQAALDSQTQGRFFVSTESSHGNPSAAFRTQYSSSAGAMTWFVWDNGAYVDTGVAVAADTWTQLILELDMLEQNYTAHIDGVEVAGSVELDFGGGGTTNITAVGFGRNNTAGDIYFDAVRFDTNVPEPATWLALAGLLASGGLPWWWRRRTQARLSPSSGLDA